MTDAARTLAEQVRAACLQTALDAYEDAGLRGLCAEGRWECAVDALRSLSLSEIVARSDAKPVGGSEPKG